MRVYLDCCSLQRPFDDRRQPRINVEAEAVLTILALVESGDLELLSSEVLEFEIANTRDALRQARVRDVLKLAGQVVKLTDETEAEAEIFVASGVTPIDALHLATASGAQADYFCTCDDPLLKKAKKFKRIKTKVPSS